MNLMKEIYKKTDNSTNLFCSLYDGGVHFYFYNKNFLMSDNWQNYNSKLQIKNN